MYHQFPFRVDTPLVELQVQREWCKVSDATVKFTVVSNYQRSSWDWVAIYKVYCISCTSSLNVPSQFDALSVCCAQVGFRHHKDYQAYVWAKGEHATQVRHMLNKKSFYFLQPG